MENSKPKLHAAVKVEPAESDAGLRIDVWLAQHYPDHSRSYWQKKLKSREVRVNRKPVSVHYALRLGDVIQIQILTPTQIADGEAMPLSILFEDDQYAVIDKPAGLVVHPGAGHSSHTLVDGLLHHFKNNLSTRGGTNRPGIVHRLDKDTSGLMLIAKTDEAHRFLSEQFLNKKVSKEYLSLLDGLLVPYQGSIEAPLSRNIHHRKKITVTSRAKSRYALTHYHVKKTFDAPLPCSFTEIRIETGRTHQIRVHFQAIGHSVLGDPVYGRPTSNRITSDYGLHRQFLHAHKLSFISPSTQKLVHYKSTLPRDLSDFLDQLT